MIEKVKILIVEDEALVATDLMGLLKERDYEVTGIAFNYNKAIEALKDEVPDLVLLDINLGNDLDGVRIAEVINKEYQIPFIYITSYGLKSVGDAAKLTKPLAYIVKPFRETDLFAAIEIGMYNNQHVNQKKELTREAVNNNLGWKITDKEFEILIDLNAGMTNKMISEKQHLSINTVKSHMRSLFLKLNVTSRFEALAKLRALS